MRLPLRARAAPQHETLTSEVWGANGGDQHMTKLIYPSRRRFMGLAGAVGASLDAAARPFGAGAGRRAASGGQGRGRRHRLRPMSARSPMKAGRGATIRACSRSRKPFRRSRHLEVESVPYSADATRIFRQFVSDGACMVFDSSNYGDFLYAVERRGAGGRRGSNATAAQLRDNLGWYYIAHWYPTYVIGVAAGMLSKIRQARLCRLVPGAVGLFRHATPS